MTDTPESTPETDRPDLPAAARRALAEAEERRRLAAEAEKLNPMPRKLAPPLGDLLQEAWVAA